MALIQIACDRNGALSGSNAKLPRHRPVVILLHGFQYAPGTGNGCPHHSLYARESMHPALRSRSWPKRLQVGNDDISAIGFGWPGRGSVWSAWRAAEVAGRSLGDLISVLKSEAPERPIHIIGHSMGVRVATTALLNADPNSVDRVIALNAADFASHVESAAARHARSLSFYNVTSRENALFDALVEWCLPAGWLHRNSATRGIDAPNALTLRLDRPQHLETLKVFGFDLPPPNKRICHWSTYLRAGTGAFYRAILDGRVHFATMKQALTPEQPRLLPFLTFGRDWALDASTHPRLSVDGKT